MNGQDKWIAGILVFQALTAGAALIWQAAASPLPMGTLLVMGPLSLLALIAGIGSFKGKRWARICGLLVFFVQIVSVATPSFFFAFWLGVHFDISFGWFGWGKIGVNLIALAMAGWAGSRLLATGRAV